MPLGGMGVTAGLGLIGGIIPAATNGGNNGYRAGSFEQDGGYNPNAFQYGGSATGPQSAAGQQAMYQANALNAQGRQAAQLDQGQMNQSRGQQEDALGLQRSAAMGLQPSVAQLQMQGAMEDNARQQMSQAASARGPQAMAMSQYGAAANTANANQGIAYQSGVLRAQEMAQARDAYMNGASGIRAGDFGAANANLGANMQQRGLNDQASIANYQLSNQVGGMQLNAQGQQQGMLANSQANANSLNAGANQHNADNWWKQYGAAMGGVQGAASGKGLQGAGGGGGGGGPPVGGGAGSDAGMPSGVGGVNAAGF